MSTSKMEIVVRLKKKKTTEGKIRSKTNLARARGWGKNATRVNFQGNGLSTNAINAIL